jgi:hypothetical protein
VLLEWHPLSEKALQKNIESFQRARWWAHKDSQPSKIKSHFDSSSVRSGIEPERKLENVETRNEASL